MIKVAAVLVLLAVAQIIPSCGGRSGADTGTGKQIQVIGWVDEKRKDIKGFFPWLIVINQQEYGVPYEFWLKVDIGDLVKYDGETWSIVRKARG